MPRFLRSHTAVKVIGYSTRFSVANTGQTIKLQIYPTFKKRSRKELEAFELKALASYAMSSRGAHSTRQFDEQEHEYRTAFQRDRDRIIHSRAFRRLKHKRQVFLTAGSDHYRTRITHTLEVSQLSRTIARVLGLNEDLVEAIALGHDLGHTPFGHLGELVLDEIMSGRRGFESHNPEQTFGGFKHNYQSLRVVDFLEKKYSFDGLNLSAPVREGILKHTRLKKGQFDFPDFCYEGLRFELDTATTLEGQVVAICDEIAQRTHDLEDGIRAGLVELKKVRKLQIVQRVEENLGITSLATEDQRLYQGLLIKGLINFLVDDVIEFTLENISKYCQKKGRLSNFDEELFRFSPKINPLQKKLNKFIYNEIIDFSRVQWSDELGKKLLYRLFESYYNDPSLLPDYVHERYFQQKGDQIEKLPAEVLQKDSYYFRIICDYIAGMTDQYAIREAKRLGRAKKFQISDLNLELALGEHEKIGRTT